MPLFSHDLTIAALEKIAALDYAHAATNAAAYDAVQIARAALRELETQPTSQPCECPMRPALQSSARNLYEASELLKDSGCSLASCVYDSSMDALRVSESPCPVQADHEAVLVDRNALMGRHEALTATLLQKDAEIERLKAQLAQAREDSKRLLNVARGCHDYGGGYREEKEIEIFHHGIQTVINSLEAAVNQPDSLQIEVLESIGGAALAGKPQEDQK